MPAEAPVTTTTVPFSSTERSCRAGDTSELL
jgi:hypothetical protein